MPNPLDTIDARKHVVLLVVLLVAAALQPTAQGFVQGVLLFDLLFFVLALAVFLVIFASGWQRRVATGMGLAMISSNGVSHVLSGGAKLAAAVSFHGFAVAFMAFAVGVILRGIFQNRRITADHVIGAFCGFLLAGVAWGNLYAAIHLLSPEAFTIAPALAGQLAHENSRRFLFNYYSFITLTTVGYGDITPVLPAACSLSWLEAAFGQFYVAVFVGQLVGLKLAQRDAPAA